MSPLKTSYEEDRGQPNFGYIRNDGRWLARIQFNGELLPAQQQAIGKLWAGAPKLLEMVCMLITGLEWNIENHPTICTEADDEALAEAQALVAQLAEIRR